jgi:hypothetical protein
MRFDFLTQNPAAGKKIVLLAATKLAADNGDVAE